MKKFNKNNKNAVDPRFIEDHKEFERLYIESFEPFMQFLKEQVYRSSSQWSFMKSWTKFPIFKDPKATKQEKLKLLKWLVNRDYNECIAEFPFHIELAMDYDPEYKNIKEVHFNYLKSSLEKVNKSLEKKNRLLTE